MKKAWYLLPVVTAYVTAYIAFTVLPPSPTDAWWAAPTAVLFLVIFGWSLWVSLERAN